MIREPTSIGTTTATVRTEMDAVSASIFSVHLEPRNDKTGSRAILN